MTAPGLRLGIKSEDVSTFEDERKKVVVFLDTLIHRHVQAPQHDSNETANTRMKSVAAGYLPAATAEFGLFNFNSWVLLSLTHPPVLVPPII